MAKNKNWFDPAPVVKPTTARMVRFGNVAQTLVPGAGAVLDTVYIERQKVTAGRVKTRAEVVENTASDFVLRLISE